MKKKDDGGVDVMYSKDDSIHKVGDINSHITDISNNILKGILDDRWHWHLQAVVEVLDNILALLLAQNVEVNLRLLGVDLLGP